MFRSRIVRAVATAAVVAATVTGAAAQPAAASPGHRLVRVHHCAPMSQPIVPPVAGYLIVDTASRSGRLFYRDSGSLTSGLFVGNGGTWVLRYWCTR